MWVIFQLYIYKNMWQNRNSWIFYEIFEADFEIKWVLRPKLTEKDRFRAENDQRTQKINLGSRFETIKLYPESVGS